MKIKLASLLALVVLLSGCALFATPQDVAQAESIRVQNDYAAKHNVIQLQYEQERADIMAGVQAEIDRQRELNKLDLQKQQDLKQLELWYQGQLAAIQAQTDRTRADALRDVAIALALAVGAAGLLILAGWGIGHGIKSYARNKGESVYPKDGQWPALVRPEGIYLPGRVPGAYMLVGKPGLPERAAQIVAYLVHVKRGQIAPPPNGEGWVRLPALTPEQLQITSNDQSTNMLAAATHGVSKGEVQRAATDGATHVARTIFGVNLTQLPAPRTIVVRPDDLRRLDFAGGRLEDDR